MRWMILLLLAPLISGCSAEPEGIEWPQAYTPASSGLPEGYILPVPGTQRWVEIEGPSLGLQANPGRPVTPEGAPYPPDLRDVYATVLSTEEGPGLVLVMAYRWDSPETVDDVYPGMAQQESQVAEFPCWYFLQHGPVLLRIVSDETGCDAAQEVRAYFLEDVGAESKAQVYQG